MSRALRWSLGGGAPEEVGGIAGVLLSEQQFQQLHLIQFRGWGPGLQVYAGLGFKA